MNEYYLPHYDEIQHTYGYNEKFEKLIEWEPSGALLNVLSIAIDSPKLPEEYRLTLLNSKWDRTIQLRDFSRLVSRYYAYALLNPQQVGDNPINAIEVAMVQFIRFYTQGKTKKLYHWIQKHKDMIEHEAYYEAKHFNEAMDYCKKYNPASNMRLRFD